jgi:S-DNA-T family DNA segregation ATPase FtsK/SpoIIIE
MADRDIDLRLDDAETIDATPAPAGPPVDQPHTVTFADVVSRADERRPIVPANLRSRAGRHAMLVLAVAMVTHGIAWQLSRSPLYLGQAIRYTPKGMWLAAYRPVRWARADELNWGLRQQAAVRNDADTYLKLTADRRKEAGKRWPQFWLGAVPLVVALVLAKFFAPTWAQAVIVMGAFMLFARLGRPSDRPIIEHAFNPNRYIRLTADLTRAALAATDTRIKDPASLKFNREIYRDGPGYTAEVTLTTGVIATDIIDRRDYLAAGFQLPMAQVWPEPVRGAHPGVLAIWVADRPVDRMKQRPTSLLTCGPLDYWGPLPWGDDVRMRALTWRLASRNSIFGGMAGSGKTYAARNVSLAAAMDPLVRFTVSELKGSGDFDAMEPLCLPKMYASGADDRTKRETMDILYWLDGECERRGPAIRKLAVKGLNNENVLNRAMAEADPSLSPLVAIFDEIQELITDPEHGKEAKRLLTSIVKRTRFAGIHIILSTQRVDKESVPRGISSNVHNRLCLAVPSHVETDLILGTGAYSRGARPTTFVPPTDDENPWAGWGYLAGREQPVRASYIDNPTAEAIVGKALVLRGDMPDVDLEGRPDRDVLADVIRVFAHTNRRGLHWQQLAELLAAEQPQLYAGMSQDALSAQMRALGVPSEVVSVDGRNLRGCRLVAVEMAHRTALGQGDGNGDTPISGGS